MAYIRLKVVWLLAVCLAAASAADTDPCLPSAPCYSEAGIVNAASFARGALSPNTIAAIFGSNLSYSTRALVPDDVQGGRLPLQLAGVTVHIGPELAPLYFVSPAQINALIPGNLNPGKYEVRVVRDGWSGPGVNIILADSSPALFLMDSTSAVASHPDFSVVTPSSPARAGAYVILWATGLGPVVPPPAAYAQLPTNAAWIERLAGFKVLLDGVPVDPGRIGYAGIAPYLAGVYQINVNLPEGVGHDPEVALSLGDAVSPRGVRLAVGNED